ncbi:uncharacterized protein LOC144304052 [Canis aureus]
MDVSSALFPKLLVMCRRLQQSCTQEILEEMFCGFNSSNSLDNDQVYQANKAQCCSERSTQEILDELLQGFNYSIYPREAQVHQATDYKNGQSGLRTSPIHGESQDPEMIRLDVYG